MHQSLQPGELGLGQLVPRLEQRLLRLQHIEQIGDSLAVLQLGDAERLPRGIDFAPEVLLMQFLAKYGRWNSPKYLFGESYGTPRSANLINVLETEDDTDFNGVILLSQILNFDDAVDIVHDNPGVDLPYELALPTYAATAWYHHKLPGASQSLDSLLSEVEQFAMGDYAAALRAGSTLSSDQRDAIAAKLHDYTGLPASYIEKADLRIDGGEFEHSLQGDDDLTTGRLDSRFSGPSLDPLSERADYDPQSAAIGSAYVAAFNGYVRSDLHYGTGMRYRPEYNVFEKWDFQHQPPGFDTPQPQALNVMPDLANAMKYDPDLKVMGAARQRSGVHREHGAPAGESVNQRQDDQQ